MPRVIGGWVFAVRGALPPVEKGSYLRLIDFVYHSTLGLRVIQKEKRLPSAFQGAMHQQGFAIRALKPFETASVQFGVGCVQISPPPTRTGQQVTSPWTSTRSCVSGFGVRKLIVRACGVNQSTFGVKTSTQPASDGDRPPCGLHPPLMPQLTTGVPLS